MTPLTTADELIQHITLLVRVAESDALMALGGVGCLLQTRPSSEPAQDLQAPLR